ncbi:BON domain-containing protein [Nitrosococcus wardiae]|uniref:Osmotically-inducible protein Y n=1 Tax=Nitrosococcus wardiae TaxID=1814290 RepID=A0A4P7C4B0_9GAMM|nr:BON domain-containing protein [Nitrosococcus wardiae]QBQ55682.1 BON domain-containing protein [Nitrosococcus wardiae]
MKKPDKYKIFILIILMTILMLGCASSPEKGRGEYVSDAWITSKVKSALIADPQVSGFDIQVETYRGIVQLSGFVDTREQSREAEDVARSIEGVRDVENRITVK